MNSVAVTQTVRLLGRVLTLSYLLEIEGILKHTNARLDSESSDEA